jgi:replicative DNA helicase
MTNNSNIKIPPQSLESEKALLGSIMIRPESLIEVFDFMSPSHFYSDRHKKIYDTVLDLYANNKPIDMVSLAERLKELSLLDAIGSRVYLSEIVESVPSSANIVHYAEIVYSKAMLRKLISAAEHISALGYNEARETEEILDEAEKKIFEITNQNSNKTVVELKETLGEAWDRLESLHKNKDEMRGIPTGFKGLDNKLAGLQNSDLFILAARPSMGKTSLALDICRNVAINQKKPVIVFSLEMSSQQLTDRMLAAQANVDAWKLRNGRLSAEDDFERIRDALNQLASAPIFIDFKPANNLISMRSVARKLKSEKGLGLIVVDYLQLMDPIRSRNSDNMVQQVTENSRGLKALARELDVPVICLSQLSRKVEDRGGRPRLSDLRDSGSIEQDADVVAFIHREDKYKEQNDKNNIAQILIEKHRNGPTGMVELYFDDKRSSFMDIDATHQESNFDDF